MKNVLIIGANSYIGTNAAQWLSKFPDDFMVEKISVRDDSWRNNDFSKYDVVLHVAGIAHIKENKKNASLYYKVNRDLAYEVALKSKQSGVKQFIFMSSMSVYGIDNGVIDQHTIPQPKSHYGKSKLQAEELISSLNASIFNVAILRPPMIYGKASPGNYSRLVKITLKTPIFPMIENKRSMIYIDNLCEFLKIMINKELQGTFFPQNKNYICTSQMVSLISLENNKRIYFTKLFNYIIKKSKHTTINKLFGDLVYSEELSSNGYKYNLVDFPESILESEKRSF